MQGRSQEHYIRRAIARMSSTRSRAGEDVNAFIEFTLMGPGGRRARQDPAHERWQEHWDKYQSSVLLAPVGTGKTSALRSRLLHMIGRDPNIQIAYISATERHPKKVIRAMKSEIERNPRVKQVFPKLKPGKIWTATEFEVSRTSRDPDPTVQVFGAFSQSVLGTRADVVVFDDFCNFENTITEHARERATEWAGEVISRLKPSARVMAIGHIFHEHDQLQRWSKIDGWGYLRDEASYRDEDGVEHPLTPGVMSLADIAKKEVDLGPVLAEMMLRNRLPSKSLGRFKQSWFDACLARGRGLEFRDRWDQGMTYTGVDLGHRKKPGSDLTVAVTVAVLPDGTRMVIDIRSGLWSAPEILRELKDIHLRYGSILAVENNGAQQHLIDFAHDLDTLPVRPHATTGVNKHDMQHGVEAMGIEFSQAKWMLPCSNNMELHPDMALLLKGCLTYDPTRHSADHLMAAWICREAIRMSPAAAGLEIPDIDTFTR